MQTALAEAHSDNLQASMLLQQFLLQLHRHPCIMSFKIAHKVPAKCKLQVLQNLRVPFSTWNAPAEGNGGPRPSQTCVQEGARGKQGPENPIAAATSAHGQHQQGAAGTPGGSQTGRVGQQQEWAPDPACSQLNLPASREFPRIFLLSAGAAGVLKQQRPWGL